MAEFLGMGGYALYVWGSFGAAAAVFAWNLAAPARARRAMLRTLRAGAPPDDDARGPA